ncbi:MAG: penicillin-binding transpeptidase domain-containing protein [Pyrinomonadaceae bacterium]
MFPKLSRVSSFFVLVAVAMLLTGSVLAQSKKAAAKKAVAKKAATTAKDAKKDRAKASAKAKQDKKEKLTAKTKDNKNDKAKKDPKKAAESKAAAAERRRKEAERRAAIIAEQRRREQARREAIARKAAFENNLRIETVANISKDNTEGEDLNIRNVAINALGSNAGSVVVMEAQTGKVLTIVNQDWAVRSTIRPCSTIKLVTGVAAINEGVISKENGSIRNVSTRRNLDDSLAFSDNPYFQRAGVQMGNAKLVEYGQKLGLGQQTGVNLEGEATGRLPFSNSNPRIYSHGDDTEVSTIQLAVMAAAITNGGHRVLPRIPRGGVANAKFQTFYKANVDVPSPSVRRVIPGMMGAAEYGTARRNMNQTLGVAGKTGSCIDKGSWVGLFASVAPIEQPKYAVAVITRGQRQRGRIAAAVAAQVYNALAGNIVRTDRNLAQTEFKIAPRNAVDTKTLAEIGDAADDDEADETDAAATTAAGNPNVIIVPSAPRDATPKKLVTKTADSKPVFPPVVITYDKDEKGKKQKP